MVMTAAGDMQSAFEQYLAEIGRYPLLSARQELALSKVIHDDPLQPDEATLMITFFKGRLPTARDAYTALVQCNLRLVVDVAKHYPSAIIDIGDLVGEGNLGLMRAAQKYDWRRDNRFSTCACWWIRQAILRKLQTHGSHTGYAAATGSLVGKILRLYRGGNDIADIATTVKLSIPEVINIISINIGVYSINAPVTDDGSATLEEIVPDPDTVAPTPNDMAEIIERVLAGLSQLERDVIVLSYCCSDKPMSLRDIARQVNVSPETVRTTRIRARQKLADSKQLKQLTLRGIHQKEGA